jgi:hypothetical protein
MICSACRAQEHDDCKAIRTGQFTWCDCQHLASGVNWIELKREETRNDAQAQSGSQ